MMENPTDKLASALHRYMNSHGFGFQYAVVKQTQEVAGFFSASARWNLVGCEIPVEVRNKDTRIDMVLGNYDHTFLMVCECKRANPALRDWCFLRAPYVSLNHNERFVVDRVRGDGVNIEACGVALKHFSESAPYYHHATEIKGGEKGEEHSGGRGAIEEAIAQVLRGTNGLMNLILEHADHQTDIGKWRCLIPVVFTTAKLFASDKVIDADLSTGNTESIGQLTEVPFVYLYHVSPALRFPAVRRKRADLQTFVQAEYIRTVVIVTANGIETFLQKHCPQNFDISAI